MNTIRKEVRELISVTERIQRTIQKGDQLPDDERGLWKCVQANCSPLCRRGRIRILRLSASLFRETEDYPGFLGDSF